MLDLRFYASAVLCICITWILLNNNMLTYPLFCGMIISPYLQDLVVGAPYEGRGVVYLYQGGPGGLNPRPSQLVRYIWDVDILGDP